MFAALSLALLALGLGVGVAIGAWSRPLQSNKSVAAPTYTDQQVADAKADVCNAYQKVQQALDIAGARDGGDDPTAILAVATSGRQVLDFGSRYLTARLVEEPATPPDLAREVRALSDKFRELTLSYLDGLTKSDSDVQAQLQAGDEAALAIQRLCK